MTVTIFTKNVNIMAEHHLWVVWFYLFMFFRLSLDPLYTFQLQCCIKSIQGAVFHIWKSVFIEHLHLFNGFKAEKLCHSCLFCNKNATTGDDSFPSCLVASQELLPFTIPSRVVSLEHILHRVMSLDHSCSPPECCPLSQWGGGRCPAPNLSRSIAIRCSASWCSWN